MKNTPSSTNSDLELFEAVERDDLDCFGLLYNKFYDHLVLYINKYYKGAIESGLRSAEDVDDAIRELSINSLSLLRINIQTGSYELSDKAKMSTYLIGICKHLVSQYLKRRLTTTYGLEGVLMDGLAEDLDLPRYDQGQIEAMRSAIETLRDENPKCFKLLNLYVNKQKMSEIARSLNFSTVDSAKSQKFKCVKLLQSIYFKLNGEN